MSNTRTWKHPTDMHENLWADIHLKQTHAEYFLQRMAESIQPPENTHMNVALIVSGAIIDTGWQRSFYANLDAFLVMTRSIAEIIEFCFGRDRLVKRDVFEALDTDEQSRRLQFSDEFKDHRSDFQQHPLSKQRNISFHRTGYADVEVKIAGRFGIDYIGGPTKVVPISESRPLEDIGNDAAKMFAATRPPSPVHPHWSDFTIDGKALFEECRAYLMKASGLVSEAQEIARRVHGDKMLTPLLLP